MTFGRVFFCLQALIHRSNASGLVYSLYFRQSADILESNIFCVQHLVLPLLGTYVLCHCVGGETIEFGVVYSLIRKFITELIGMWVGGDPPFMLPPRLKLLKSPLWYGPETSPYMRLWRVGSQLLFTRQGSN